METVADALPKILDPDTCPAGFLPIYGSWMGIDLPEDAFAEPVMRRLVKEAWQLNRMKGTKWVIARIMKIILDEDVIIKEKNLLDERGGG